jgi:crotonobetaine/carnitine-CoA ligase
MGPGATVRTYDDLLPTFDDPATWNLPWILRERARTHGERVYLDVPGEALTLTFSEVLARAEAIASGLLSDGASRGDRVLIMAPNRSEVVLSWFGACLAGMVEVPINTAYAGTFLEHQVRTTEPATAVVHPDYAERFLDGDGAYASIERFYVLGEDAATSAAIGTLQGAGFDALPWTSLTAHDSVSELPEVQAHDLASIFFTSGTTGLSKGVMMPHAHMTFFADECVSLTRLTDADTYMCVGPLFHGNAQFLAAYPALIAGARFVLREKFSASRWVDQLRESGATVTNFVGVMMDWTWKQPARPDDADNQLRCVFAAPTASSILDGFRTRFGVEAFVEVFGLTETAAPFLSPYGEERPPGAAGLLATRFFEARLVDPETDREVAVGEVGELVVRHKQPWTMCAGYYGMPEKTAEVQRNLWFHTGDGLRRDADGWYYFVDRLKDAIRRRGENISSYEVEQAVLGHPDVLECAVVPAPTASEAGEDEVAVFAVVAEGSATGVEVVREWCDRKLPAFARPEYVILVEELPMTPSGKVRKIELRELAVEYASAAEGAAR